MPSIDIDAYLDDESDSGPAKRIQRKKRRLGQREKQARVLSDLIQHAEKAPVDVQQGFSTTFQPAEHERFWLLSYLEEFYQANLITDVLWKVKGGKEANVYCCKAHPSTGLDLIAAKVYRPQMFRNLRNDARYRQGRELVGEDGKVTRSRREALAVRKNTRFGQQLRHVAWLGAEFETLKVLFEAGADVPQPFRSGDNVILMEYVGEEKDPAPTLNQVNLTRGEARELFDRLVNNLAIMLACHRVHADLSAYNILYWAGDFKIIDFPQAVDPRRNPDAAELFARDVERVCQYFARYQLGVEPRRLASDLWSRFRRENARDAGTPSSDPQDYAADEPYVI